MQKRQNVSQKFTYWLKVVSLGLILGLGLQFAQAWTAPTVAPPGGNVAGPVTTGALSQAKSGGLTLGGLLLAGKSNCDLKTNAVGTVTCGVDAVGGGGGGDNLGNHTATQNVNMVNNRIYGLAGGGGNSIGWGNLAGTGNGIYSDGANGNMAVRMSGAFYIQNQAGTGSVPLIAGNSVFAGTMSLSNNRITNVANPVGGADAATKGYVDGMVGSSAPVKAWFWWEGGLKAAGNIASVADSGNQVTVYFSTPMSSANYAVVCNGSLTASNNPTASELAIYAYNRTATSFYVEGMIPSGSDNIVTVDCAVYGN